MSEQTDPNIALLGERNWLEGLLTLRAAVGDRGLGMGQADIHYGRATGYWTITLRPDTETVGPNGGLPESALGGLHPELRARITAAEAVLGDFRREQDAYLGGGLTPIYVDHALRLEAELRGLLDTIRRAADNA